LGGGGVAGNQATLLLLTRVLPAVRKRGNPAVWR